MKLYVYGLVEPAGEPLPADLSGLGGSLVRIQTVGSVQAILSDFPWTTLNANKESVLAHQTVLEKILERRTPLPFRFGNVVTSDQLAGFVEKFSSTLLSDLERVRGCVQMSVKLVSRKGQEPVAETEGGPGTRFLKEKQVRRDALIEATEWLNETLKPLIRGVETNIRIIPRPIASVAHLIAREAVEDYRSRFRQAGAARPEYSCLQTGPWPPYSFVKADPRS
jgi:hypothetical protein